MEAVVPLLQPRAGTMVEMAEMAEFFVVDDDQLALDEAAATKFLTGQVKEHFAALHLLLCDAPDFSQTALETLFARYLEEKGVAFKILAQPLRVALTGKTKSPGLFETMAVLGRDRVLRRLANALQRME